MLLEYGVSSKYESINQTTTSQAGQSLSFGDLASEKMVALSMNLFGVIVLFGNMDTGLLTYNGIVIEIIRVGHRCFDIF